MKRNNAAGRLHYTTDYKSAYKDPDAIFIGVGTPEQPDGSANLSYIATVCRQIAENVEKDCLVVVKSTVPVGTNDHVEQFIKDFLDKKRASYRSSIESGIFGCRALQYMIRCMRQELSLAQKVKRQKNCFGKFMNRFSCRLLR